MFPGERLPDPMLQAAAREATRLCQPLELAQFHLRFAQGERDATFLPLQQLFALHHYQCTVQLAHRGSLPRRAHVAELARQPFHCTAPHRPLQRLFRGFVSERQRDETAVAGGVEVELQLRAPEPTVAYQRTLPRGQASLTLVECLVQLSQPIQARPQHCLVRAVAGIGPIQKRHMSRLADQQAEPDHTRNRLLLLLACPRRASSPGVTVAM